MRLCKACNESTSGFCYRHSSQTITHGPIDTIVGTVCPDCNKLRAKLTAAEAVVEAAREVVDICGWDDELQTTGVPLTGLTNTVTKLRTKLHKLQGGDGDE